MCLPPLKELSPRPHRGFGDLREAGSRQGECRGAGRTQAEASLRALGVKWELARLLEGARLVLTGFRVQGAGCSETGRRFPLLKTYHCPDGSTSPAKHFSERHDSESCLHGPDSVTVAGPTAQGQVPRISSRGSRGLGHAACPHRASLLVLRPGNGPRGRGLAAQIQFGKPTASRSGTRGPGHAKAPGLLVSGDGTGTLCKDRGPPD